MAKALELTIEGRKIRQVLRSTVRHDLYIMDKLRKAGLTVVSKRDDETAEEFARRLLEELVKADVLVPMLAACFIDAGKDDLAWTVESCAELESFFNNVSDPADKQLIFSMAVRLLADFFVSGVASIKVSLSSSENLRGPEQRN